MLREELSEEKRKEYDALTAKTMGEIEEERACKAAGKEERAARWTRR